MYAYIAPYAAATIGPWVSNKLSGVSIFSSRINAIDVAEITLPDEGLGIDAITKGMPVAIALGYREVGMWPTFAGRVDDVSWGRIVTIYCKDRMEDLRKDVKITKSFVDATPQEIVKYGLTQAGIADFALGTTPLPRRHHFVSRSLNVIQLVKQVNRTWGLDWSFYFEPDGRFCWQPWEESDRYNGGQPMATLEYGQNILDLVPSDEQTGTLTTFSLPFIKHSNLIILRDRRFWESEVLVRAERIHYNHGEKATEMKIEWRIQAS